MPGICLGLGLGLSPMSLPEKLRQCQMSMSSAKCQKSVNVMRCYVKGSSRSSSVVDDSARPINWLSREGGKGVIQIAIAVEMIWVEIDCYLGRNGRGTTGCLYVCVVYV